MKRVLFLATLVLLGASLVLGPMWVWRHLQAATDTVRSEIDAKVTDEHLSKLLGQNLRELEQQIRTYHVGVAKIADQAAAAQARLEELQRQAEQEKKLLARIKDMLDQASTSYDIAGKTYTRDELKADGKVRLSNCQQLETKIDNQSKLVAQLKKGLEEGRANLTQAQRLKQEMAGEFETLKSRLVTARARQEVGELVAVLKDMPLAPNSDLSKKFAELRDRVRAAEVACDYQDSRNRGGGVIDWQGNGSAEDISQAIAQFLQTKPGQGN